jgi:hypothetical protein
MELWIPRSGAPRFRCRICTTPFYEGEQRKYEFHVAQCAKRHHDELAAQSPTNMLPFFYRVQDPEKEQALREGRIGLDDTPWK